MSLTQLFSDSSQCLRIEWSLFLPIPDFQTDPDGLKIDLLVQSAAAYEMSESQLACLT